MLSFVKNVVEEERRRSRAFSECTKNIIMQRQWPDKQQEGLFLGNKPKKESKADILDESKWERGF